MSGIQLLLQLMQGRLHCRWQFRIDETVRQRIVKFEAHFT
ncbi:Uncharacterised protein [Vibrio cholerae]|nr:Uncharacterised protein [Vibrio cholerae]